MSSRRSLAQPEPRRGGHSPAGIWAMVAGVVLRKLDGGREEMVVDSLLTDQSSSTGFEKMRPKGCGLTARRGRRAGMMAAPPRARIPARTSEASHGRCDAMQPSLPRATRPSTHPA